MTKKKSKYDCNFFIPPWLDLNNNLDKKNSRTNIDAIEELEKKIKELKSVEQWLNLNLNILHSTIQGLEIQKNTISSLTLTEKSKKNNKADRATKTSRKGDPASQFSDIMANSTQLWWKSVEDQMEEILKANAKSKTPKKSSLKKKRKSRPQQQTKPRKKMV